MKYTARIENQTYEIDIVEKNGKPHVQLDGKPVNIDLVKLGDGMDYSLLLGQSSYELIIDSNAGAYHVQVDGETYPVTIQSEREQLLRSDTIEKSGIAGLEEIRAPMPGLVVDIEVTVGDSVTKGDGLAIVEAMKMENELTAPVDGLVKEIPVQKGQTVEKDQVLVIIQS